MPLPLLYLLPTSTLLLLVLSSLMSFPLPPRISPLCFWMLLVLLVWVLGALRVPRT